MSAELPIPSSDFLIFLHWIKWSLANQFCLKVDLKGSNFIRLWDHRPYISEAYFLLK